MNGGNFEELYLLTSNGLVRTFYFFLFKKMQISSLPASTTKKPTLKYLFSGKVFSFLTRTGQCRNLRLRAVLVHRMLDFSGGVGPACAFENKIR